MDGSSLEALAFDQSKCSTLSMEQKRKLVYDISQHTDSAPEILHSWSRHELIQILCQELGKERKYTGLTKSKIIEHLLRIVSEKKSQEGINVNVSEALKNDERSLKRPRKPDHPNPVYCKNSACQAKMNGSDEFCKRCSCFICRMYDDNKDPSLWLICTSDPPFCGASCGVSCHLECAVRHENSGISKDKGLDGSFCCVSCGKVNDLLGSWRKHLVVAKETRRVDILCYRLFLSQKILSGTKHYQNLYEIVDEAVKKLEHDVGPLTGLPVKMARGIVNRLESGPEIQRLCGLAVESLDLVISSRVSDTPYAKFVRFEDIRASSLTIILNPNDLNLENIATYTLWYRKADDLDYPSEPTCTLFSPNTRFLLTGLSPATRYFLKVDMDRERGLFEFEFQTRNSQDETPNAPSNTLEVKRSQSQSVATNYSSLSNPSSVEDETNNGIDNRGDNYPPFCGINGDKSSTVNLLKDAKKCTVQIEKDRDTDTRVVETITENGSNIGSGLECVPYVDSSEAVLPITPCKLENVKNRPKNNGKDIDKGFEYYMKVIRLLECEGHIETTFRQKLLTWYSLRATPQEERVVKVFVDTFIEDPESLAGQLVDAFSDVVSNKRCCTVPAGFCVKLWH